MRITIHQPEHLPWIGFFHKIGIVDIYVALDNVQYRHKYFQNRNRIRGSSGEEWLNVPVLVKGRRPQLIEDVEINSTDKRWKQKNWKAIFLNYRKSSYFARYSDYFEVLYTKEWKFLADLNLNIIQNCMRFLGLNTKIVKASQLGVSGKGPQLLLDICKALNADIYVSGISGIAGKGKVYEDDFSRYGIKVIYDEFHHPVYEQMRKPFMPCMSIIDLLFNHGAKSMDIINGTGVSVMKKVFH